MSQRLTIRGQSWLEPTSSPDSCRCCYQIEIEVKVPALSSFLEQGLEKRMRDSYSKVPELTARYVTTDGCRRFFAGLKQAPPTPSPLTGPATVT